jgi:hypothetical protein
MQQEIQSTVRCLPGVNEMCVCLCVICVKGLSNLKLLPGETVLITALSLYLSGLGWTTAGSQSAM